MKAASSEAQLVRRLAGAGRRLLVEGDKVRLVSASGAEGSAVHPDLFVQLRASGALTMDAPGSWRLSQAGLSRARRLATPGEDMSRQHQLRGQVSVGEGSDQRFVSVDLGESPLGWLRARKGRDGEPLIDDAAFAAGERIRADFTRGQMMPSITTNWSPVGSAPRRSGAAGGAGDLTDAALAARLRVERALAALGPELSGTVLDFCCFLKGIETIEQERHWPKRSARLVLQLGLSALARHYGFAREGDSRGRRQPSGGAPRSDVA